MQKQLPKIIWIMWYQGFESAPLIIKKCLQTWQAHNPDWAIHTLTRATIDNYVDIDLIVPGYKDKKMPLEAYSDIVRIALLNKYGGVWVDATLYCNQPLDSWIHPYITASGFFAFSNPAPDRMLANWFLVAVPENEIIQMLVKNITLYWAIRSERHDYFWFHHLFGDLYYTDADFKKRWDKVPEFSADGPHYFVPYQETFTKPITEDIRKQIDKPAVPVFKLTHKYDQRVLIKKSVLDYLINDPSKKSFLEKLFERF